MKLVGFAVKVVVLALLACGQMAACPDADRPTAVRKNVLYDGEFEGRLIAFLKLMHQRGRLEQADVEKALRVRLTPHPKLRKQQHYKGPTQGGRDYLVLLGPFADRIALQVILPWYGSGGQRRCLVDFRRLNAALAKDGWSGQRKEGDHPHAPRNAWKYSKDHAVMDVRYDPYGAYRRGSDINATNLCVESLLIRVGEKK